MAQALITKHLAGLFNGISEQAPTLRLETQAQNQVNGWSSLVYGLMTRPPTRFISKVANAGSDSSLYHAINRDATERYILGIHPQGNITAIDLRGFSYTIEGVEDYTQYLTTDVPKNDIAVATIADYTFIVNKTKQVEMEVVNENSATASPASCIVSISSGAVGTYIIKVNGSTIASVAGYTSSSSLDYPDDITNVPKAPNTIAAELREIIKNTNGFSATPASGGSFTFRKTTGENFTPTMESPSNYMTHKYWATATTALLYDKVGYVYVAKGVAEQNYQVIIDGVLVASYSSGTTNQASTYKTDVIANSLYSQISNKGYATEINGSVIKVTKRDSSDFTISTHDSWGEAALKCFKGRAQAFNELPARCFEGAILQIAGKTDSDEGSYWVRYETTYTRDGESVETTGVWKEYREPNKENRFKLDTMPLQLVRKQDMAKYASKDNPYGIYFEIETAMWAERKVGDADSAPAPSFVGKNISDIFLFSNRLGVLSGQAVVLSRVGDFFNFFPATVTDVLDDEPIDIDAPSLSVAELHHAIPSKDSLMLFAENQQFILNSGSDPLTTKTANITSVLHYPSDKRVAPISLGQMAYYLSPRGSYYSLREYFIQADGLIGDAPSVTDHVPTLLQYSKLRPHMCSIANEDIVLISNGTDTMYVYKSNWSGDQKTQSSWSKWVFSKAIRTMYEFDNILYILFVDGSLEKLSLIKDLSLKFIDSLEPVLANTIISGDAHKHIYNEQGELIEALPSGSKAYPYNVLVGYPYDFIYEFSPLFLKDSSEGVGMVDGRSLLRRVRLFMEGATSFKLIVKDTRNDTTRLEYNYSTPNNKAQLYNRSFLLRGDSKESTVEIRSTSDKAIVLQSASFEILVSLLVKPQ